MVRKRLRTFLVKETFTDPYTGQIHLANSELQESNLLNNGWHKEDIKTALNSLLVPYIWPKNEVKNG